MIAIQSSRASLLLLIVVLPLLVACDRQDNNGEEILRLVTGAPCDREAGCVAAKDSFSVHVFIDPDARALQPFSVRAQVPDDVQVREFSVEFAMAGMQMGVNRYRLIRGSGNMWHAEVTLPVCMSGRSDWMAQFELLSNSGLIRFDAPFSLGGHASR